MTWKKYIEGLGPREKPLADIYRGIAYNCHGPFLEVGSGWGIFSRAVLEDTNARLTTIDKLEDRQEFEERTVGFETRIERIIGSSNEVLPKLFSEGRIFGLVMVDGSHLYDDCIFDLKVCWNMLESGGTLLIDDVLHPHNWDSDYGVAHALWDFLNEALPVGADFKIIRCGSGGLAVIKKS
jgi:predicted O-methyltransferase YrrM